MAEASMTTTRVPPLSDDLRGRCLQFHARPGMEPREHLLASGERGDPLDFHEEVVGEAPSCLRRPGLDRPMDDIGDVANLNHLRHVGSMTACISHVNRTNRLVA